MFSDEELAQIKGQFDANQATASTPRPTVTPPKKKSGGIAGFVGNVAHGIAAPFEYLTKAAIVNPIRETAADITGNKVAAKNAQTSTRRNLGIGDDAKDFSGGLKKFIGNSAGALLTVAAPGTSSIKGAAATGAAGGASSALAQDGSTFNDVIAGGLAGAATGGALKGAEKVVGKVASKGARKEGGFMDNLTTQGQQMQARGLGISGGNKVNGVELTPQDTERMLSTLKREGIDIGNANITSRNLTSKLDEYGKQIADHFKTNNNPLMPKDTAVIADNFLNTIDTTDPRILKEAQVLANDLRKNVKDTKSMWEFRKKLDARIPDSKFTDAATSDKITAIKSMRAYIAKELGDVPGMEQYRELSEIKPFLAKGMRELNQGGGDLWGRVLNSGPVQKLESTAGKALEGSGKMGIEEGGTDTLANKITGSNAGNFASGILRQGTANMAGASMVPGEEDGLDTEEPIDTSSDALGLDTTIPETESDTLPNTDPFAPENIQSSVQKIIQQGGTQKDVTEFLANAKIMNDIAASSNPKGKGLNSTASGVVADTKTGLAQLKKLSGEISTSSANNPGIGWLRGKNPLDTNAQNLQASIATAKQIVGKALEGGVLRAEDEKKYAKILPTLNDTDAVAEHKIQQLIGLISGRLNEYQNSISGGSGGTDLDALGL